METVLLLLECPRVLPGVLSRDGRTAVAYAAPSAGMDVVTLLLETGKIDPGHRDSYRKIAVDWARLNNFRVVEAMLRRAATEYIHN
jgi:ankyrin repeat protein